MFTSKLSPIVRSMSTVFRGYKLEFAEFGEPLEVLQKKECTTEAPTEKEVVLKMLAAPINPVDIIIMQGKYGIKPKLPAVAGYEGVGEVVALGPSVNNLKVGDRVITLKSDLGTWRTYLKVNPSNLLKIPKELGLVEAATLSVNPCSAFRMLKDFEDLTPGDTVIQNGANSSCGQNIIQLCSEWGLKTVNIVRNRDNFDEVVHFLKSIGATHVLKEEDLRNTQIFKDGTLRRPKLALNCVGGKSSLEILRHLASDGSMVTYGGMSGEPVVVSTAALIFKNVKLLGFFMTKWSLENESSEERFKMFEELISLIINKKLQNPSHQMVNFDNLGEALSNSLNGKGRVGKKYILTF